LGDGKDEKGEMTVDKYTAKLRRDIVRNEKLATEISQVLAKYELKVPEGKMVVWGPTVVDEATSAFDIPRIWLDGIPRPELLAAAYRIQERFAL
jgi:hypothetical protein